MFPPTRAPFPRAALHSLDVGTWMQFDGQITAGAWNQQLIPKCHTSLQLLHWAASAAAVETMGLEDEVTWLVVDSWG